MASISRLSLLLLEDVDSCGTGRGTFDDNEPLPQIAVGVDPDMLAVQHKKHTKSEVTLSGLLNALDGAATPEGCVLIMTTNDPDALDSALTRPSFGKLNRDGYCQ